MPDIGSIGSKGMVTVCLVIETDCIVVFLRVTVLLASRCEVNACPHKHMPI